MTSKERITIAMWNKQPDRVPVTLGLSEIIPVKYLSDGNYIKFHWKEKIPLWKARTILECDRYNADGFLHLAYDPVTMDPYNMNSFHKNNISYLKNIRETNNRVEYTKVVFTSKGNLEARVIIDAHSSSTIMEPFAKNFIEDYEKIIEALKYTDNVDYEKMNAAYDEIGDRAHVGFWMPVPVDWFVSLTKSPQEVIMDFYDNEKTMMKLTEAYTEYSMQVVKSIFKNTKLDSLGLGGSSTSMSLINPTLHKQYSLNFGKKVTEIAHKFNKPVQYHMCGKSREGLPITAEMGVDGFDALECPPTGNVDLGEVKKTFGNKYSLRGNVNSITVMMNGSPEDVRNDVLRCFRDAKERGGYILGVGDQVPFQTSEENIRMFVEAGKEYGKY